MKYLIVEYYEGKRTVIDSTSCRNEAEVIRRWTCDTWADPNEALKYVKVEKAR